MSLSAVIMVSAETGILLSVAFWFRPRGKKPFQSYPSLGPSVCCLSSSFPYLNDGRHNPTGVRQPEGDEEVDVNFVAQAPQLPGNQGQTESLLQSQCLTHIHRLTRPRPDVQLEDMPFRLFAAGLGELNCKSPGAVNLERRQQCTDGITKLIPFRRVY